MENVSLCSAILFTFAQDYYIELVLSMAHIFSGLCFHPLCIHLVYTKFFCDTYFHATTAEHHQFIYLSLSLIDCKIYTIPPPLGIAKLIYKTFIPSGISSPDPGVRVPH